MIRSTIFANLRLCGALFAQSATSASTASKSAGDKTNPSTAQSPAAKPAAAGAHSPYRPDRFAGRAGEYYRLVWGGGLLAGKWGGAGGGIKFSLQKTEP